jgi:hypothetical protein
MIVDDAVDILSDRVGPNKRYYEAFNDGNDITAVLVYLADIASLLG